LKVLVVSHLDSQRPFGQFTRPFFLGRGIAAQGHDVANIGVDCAKVDFGPAWSVGELSLRRVVPGVRRAIDEFHPDVVYAHQNLPGVAAVIAAGDIPVVADFHALASNDWASKAALAGPRAGRRYRVASAKARLAERFVTRRVQCIIAAGERLADGIRVLYRPKSDPVVVVNGVDHRMLDAPHYDSPYEGAGPFALASMPVSTSDTNDVAMPFLADVARELDARAPHLRVHVLGRAGGPASELMRYHPLRPAVFEPQRYRVDMLPFIDHADVCLLPFPTERGFVYLGARNKLLDFLARAKRVVTTPEGLKGLEEVGDWAGVRVAEDDPTAFAGAVAESVAHGAPRLDDARTEIHERLRWDVLGRSVGCSLERVVAGATASRHGPRT
jgi:glycosyltransferase involved in cell wall biosynthesis